MTNYDFLPVTMMHLSTGQKIRAYAHPTRMAILEMLGREKQSVSGVARALEVHPANITHHFKLLEKTGLIRLVEKRDTGKNLEKLYRAAAHHFAVNLSGEPLENKKALALSILNDNLSAAIQAVKGQADDAAVFGLLRSFRLTPAGIRCFQKKLEQLLEEFEKPPVGEGVPYTVNISFYPGETGPEGADELIMRREEQSPPPDARSVGPLPQGEGNEKAEI